jgi:hypothetical protein
MNGKWTRLKDALAAVANRVGSVKPAKKEIIDRLSWGELRAVGESYVDHWIHRKDPLHRSEGDRGYRIVRNAERRMLPIASDWWAISELDWDKSTAHVRWSSTDLDHIGHENQPFQVLLNGVLLSTADIDRLWPAPTKRPNVNKLPPPSRAAIDAILRKEAKPELTQPDIKRAVQDHFKRIGKHVTDRLFRDAYHDLPLSKKRAPGETNKTRKSRAHA